MLFRSEVEMERVPLTSSSGQTSRAGLLSTTGPETHELGSDGAPVRGGIMIVVVLNENKKLRRKELQIHC